MVFTVDCFAKDPFKARVQRVIDGDTIIIHHRNKNLKVRLWGIDTPEWKQPFSRKAKLFTLHHLKSRIVEIYPKDWDDYGRLVAIVRLENRLFNQDLIEAGLAWVHIYYCKESICQTWKDLEKSARNQHLGLWNDKNPVPPWIWKRKHLY